MKKIILTFVLILSISFSFANNIPNEVFTINNEKETLLIKEKEPIKENNFRATDKVYKVVVDVSGNNTASLCTIEGKVTVTTEEGDSITVEFKVTAKTCKEAVRVQNKIIEAFE